MIKRLLVAIAALLCGAPIALADFAFTVGSGQTAVSFTASTGGTSLCAAANTHCFSRVNINSAGTEILTTAAPGVITGSGTAGTAATGVVTVQGIASGTVIPVSVSSATGLAQGSTTSGQTGSLVMGAVTTAAPSYTTAQTSPVSLDLAGNTRVAVSYGSTPLVADPCQSNAKSYLPISQTTSTQLFAGTSAKKTYVCHVFVLANAAETVTLVSGTGTVCATNPHAMIGPGSVTALSALSANGGFSLGNGGYAIAASTTNADNVCLVQLGAVQLTGVISYVAQ